MPSVSSYTASSCSHVFAPKLKVLIPRFAVPSPGRRNLHARRLSALYALYQLPWQLWQGWPQTGLEQYLTKTGLNLNLPRVKTLSLSHDWKSKIPNPEELNWRGSPLIMQLRV